MREYSKGNIRSLFGMKVLDNKNYPSKLIDPDDCNCSGHEENMKFDICPMCGRKLEE